MQDHASALPRKNSSTLCKFDDDPFQGIPYELFSTVPRQRTPYNLFFDRGPAVFLCLAGSRKRLFQYFTFPRCDFLIWLPIQPRLADESPQSGKVGPFAAWPRFRQPFSLRARDGPSEQGRGQWPDAPFFCVSQELTLP